MDRSRRTMCKIEVTGWSAHPLDVVEQITIKVAKQSSKDLFKLKSCCKINTDAANRKEVYRDLYIFGLHSVSKIHKDIIEGILKKCGEAGNIDLVFKDGMFEFLKSGEKQKLQLALERGQKDAIFFKAMILIAEDEERRDEAVQMLNNAFGGTSFYLHASNINRIRWFSAGWKRDQSQ